MLLRSFLATVSALLVQLVVTTAENVTYTPPAVNLTSCIGGVAVFSITNMVAGGLIYLRTTRGVYKVEPSFDTNGQEYIYQCNFGDCGIEWYEKFTFISQRHVDIQTSHDLHKTFICLADLISISPGGGSPYDANTTEMVRYLYRASASMTFFDTEGAELVSGSFVKLGTKVDIYINLTNNIGDMFDLTVKSCDVILLPIISGRCPVDGEMFDQFTKLSVGYLYNNFSMFRPTSTVPGAMDVLFSCTLEICRNPCPTYICNGTEAILVNDTDSDDSSRRRRQAVSSTRSRSLKLGTIFRVDYEEPVVETPVDQCMSTNTLLAVFASLGMILLATIVFMVHFILEWKRHSKPERNGQCTTLPDKTIQTISTAESSLGIDRTVKHNTRNTNIHPANDNSTKRGGLDIHCGIHAPKQNENEKGINITALSENQNKSLNASKRKLLARVISSPELLSSLSKNVRNIETKADESDKYLESTKLMNLNEKGESTRLNSQNVSILGNTPSMYYCLNSALKTSSILQQEPEKEHEQRARSSSEATPRNIAPVQKRPASTSSMQALNGEGIAIHHRIASEMVAKELVTKRARTSSSSSKGSTKSDHLRYNMILNNSVKKPFLKQISSISLPLKSCPEYNNGETSACSARLESPLQSRMIQGGFFEKEQSFSAAVSKEIVNRVPKTIIKQQNSYPKETEDKRPRSSSSFL